MKILVLNDYFSPIAGGFVVAYNLALECRKRGHEIVFLTTVQKKTDAGLSEQDGMPVYKIYTRYPLRFRGLFSVWNPFVVKEFTRIVREVRPDVIHAHVIHFYLSHYVLKLAHKLGVPTVLTAHDAMTFCYTRLRGDCLNDMGQPARVNAWRCAQCQRFRYVPFRNAATRHYINTYTAQVISVSESLKVGLENNGIQHVRAIYNGIAPEQCQVSAEDVAAFRRQHSLDGKSVILFAGRANASKGLDVLIRALAAITTQQPQVQILILSGQNAYTDYVRALAGELGVLSRLIFPGWLTGAQLKSAYAACDVCVAPSIQFEPFGLVILEAMAVKKPVIGSSLGGIPEIIDDGKTGYLVPPGDSAALAESMSQLLQQPELARQFGEAGYLRLIEKFHIAHQCDRVLAVYQEATSHAYPQ